MKQHLILLLVITNLFFTNNSYAQTSTPVDFVGYDYVYKILPTLNVINHQITKIKLIAPREDRYTTHAATTETSIEFYKVGEQMNFSSIRRSGRQDNDICEFTDYEFNSGLIIGHNNDENKFTEFNLRDSFYKVQIGTNFIKVGNDISVLQNLFPISYNYFVQQHNKDFIQILTELPGEVTIRSIWFSIDLVNRKITEITLFDHCRD